MGLSLPMAPSAGIDFDLSELTFPWVKLVKT